MSNGARFAAVPLETCGTPVAAWRATAPLPRLRWDECRALVIVGAHPDDETLGLGATAAQLAASGVDVRVISVSDGDAAHPGIPAIERERLARVRREELRAATHVLGIGRPVTLGLPDGRLADHEPALADAVSAALREHGPGTWCAATWRGDGHPDHEAVGRAAATAASAVGVPLLEYPVWMWHWAQPNDAAVPWGRAFSVDVADRFVSVKSRAARCFASQFRIPDGGGRPVLPGFVVSRLLAVREIVFADGLDRYGAL